MERNHQKEHPGIDNLIIKYVDGRITRQELDELESWLKEKEDNLKYYRQIRNVLENNLQVNANSSQALENVLQQINRKDKRGNIMLIMQRIAALLFIPLLLSFLIFFILNEKNKKNEENNYRTITAAFGTVSSFELEDGSKVWLNTGSSLQVPGRFAKNHRTVNLTGEAYFEVHSDPSSPFLVQTDGFSVKATGTRFNIMAYNDEPSSVTLAEGKVNVTIQKFNNSTENIQLLPGQHLQINPGNTAHFIENGDAYKYYAWKDGKMVFRNDLLSDIMRRISLQYNVDIETEDAIILQNRYRATFDDETLTEVLDLLKLASPFSYREIPQVNLPDGSYSKRKIIISSIKPNRKSN